MRVLKFQLRRISQGGNAGPPYRSDKCRGHALAAEQHYRRRSSEVEVFGRSEGKDLMSFLRSPSSSLIGVLATFCFRFRLCAGFT
jgi:hypothetical protein